MNFSSMHFLNEHLSYAYKWNLFFDTNNINSFKLMEYYIFEITVMNLGINSQYSCQ
jgi:hypothetical protein